MGQGSSLPLESGGESIHWGGGPVVLPVMGKISPFYISVLYAKELLKLR
jgi:hypothetical protein